MFLHQKCPKSQFSLKLRYIFPEIKDSHLLGSKTALFSMLETPDFDPSHDRGGGKNLGLEALAVLGDLFFFLTLFFFENIFFMQKTNTFIFLMFFCQEKLMAFLANRSIK